MEKMAAAAVAIFCLVLQAYEARKLLNMKNQLNGMVNSKVDVNLSAPEIYEKITLWFNHTAKILIIKPSQPMIFPNSYFKNKLLYHENHILEINQLQKQDSSTYHVVVEDKESMETTTYFQLDVYEPVPKPSVKAINSVKNGEWCKATLECTVNASQVTYQWCKNEMNDQCTNSRTWDVQIKSDSNTAYTCIVSNPVSQATSIIYYRHNCVWSEENSAVSLSLARKMADSIVAFGFLLVIHTWV